MSDLSKLTNAELGRRMGQDADMLESCGNHEQAGRIREAASRCTTKRLRQEIAKAVEETEAENSRLREAAEAVLDAETVTVHVGYDNAAGGGNFVYADAIRTDDEAFAKLRSALSR